MIHTRAEIIRYYVSFYQNQLERQSVMKPGVADMLIIKSCIIKIIEEFIQEFNINELPVGVPFLQICNRFLKDYGLNPY